MLTSIDQQSANIEGVNQGIGNQGMMFRLASNETPKLMPAPITFAHKLTKRLATVRKNGSIDFLRPDGKSQVTIEYDNGTPKPVGTVVISTQHKEDVTCDEVHETVIKEVIKKIIPKKW